MAITNEQLDITTENFNQLTSLLGLAAEVNAKTDDKSIFLNVKTEDPGRLIGRNGQTLNSLQHLLNGILLNKGKSFPRVLIDVVSSGEENKRPPSRRNNADRKQGSNQGSDQGSNPEKLRTQALDAAKEVKRWGEDVTLPSMNVEEIKEVMSILSSDNQLELAEVNGAKPNTKRVTVKLKEK